MRWRAISGGPYARAAQTYDGPPTEFILSLSDTGSVDIKGRVVLLL
jgi:hypothetical protein